VAHPPAAVQDAEHADRPHARRARALARRDGRSQAPARRDRRPEKARMTNRATELAGCP